MLGALGQSERLRRIRRLLPGRLWPRRRDGDCALTAPAVFGLASALPTSAPRSVADWGGSCVPLHGMAFGTARKEDTPSS
eukprot:14492958-Alexandrium_andersonii.AAC.1